MKPTTRGDIDNFNQSCLKLENALFKSSILVSLHVIDTFVVDSISIIIGCLVDKYTQFKVIQKGDRKGVSIQCLSQG